MRKLNIYVTGACIAVISFTVESSVFNTLNDINYEWLELTETTGLSRNEVEGRLINPNDNLFGYEYASRRLVEELFLSYTSWYGVNGNYGATDVTSGIESYMKDFGVTNSYLGNGINKVHTTRDGFTVNYDGNRESQGFYGLDGECDSVVRTCLGTNFMFLDTDNKVTFARQFGDYGWDSENQGPQTFTKDFSHAVAGSFLVREVSAVPIPAAVWLFGSGLLGLVAVARRKANA